MFIQYLEIVIIPESGSLNFVCIGMEFNSKNVRIYAPFSLKVGGGGVDVMNAHAHMHTHTYLGACMYHLLTASFIHCMYSVLLNYMCVMNVGNSHWN
jgi:hypothetical protein